MNESSNICMCTELKFLFFLLLNKLLFYLVCLDESITPLFFNFTKVYFEKKKQKQKNTHLSMFYESSLSLKAPVTLQNWEYIDNPTICGVLGQGHGS